MKTMKSPHRKGFTIVELLVVIAIIITLSAVGVSVGRSMIFKAKASVMANNMKQMSSFFTAFQHILRTHS